jgi:hypothetical protein
MGMNLQDWELWDDQEKVLSIPDVLYILLSPLRTKA